MAERRQGRLSSFNAGLNPGIENINSLGAPRWS